MSYTALTEPTLVLNKNWLPLRVCSARRALTLLFKGMARALHTDTYALYDFDSWADLKAAEGEPCIETVSLRIPVPEVIVLLACDRFARPRVVFSRRNLFRRDKNTCQYCGKRYPTDLLSIDHVVPRSMGGTSSWTNCVVACLTCNARKGNRTLEQAGMRLRREPREPPAQAAFTLPVGRRKPSWDQFVSEAYWNTELKP